jgi:hypothetical protein
VYHVDVPCAWEMNIHEINKMMLDQSHLESVMHDEITLECSSFNVCCLSRENAYNVNVRNSILQARVQMFLRLMIKC